MLLCATFKSHIKISSLIEFTCPTHTVNLHIVHGLPRIIGVVLEAENGSFNRKESSFNLQVSSIAFSLRYIVLSMNGGSRL